MEFIRYVIKDKNDLFKRVHNGFDKCITNAVMYHTYDDACIIANQLNVSHKEQKHTAHQVNINYKLQRG